MARVTVEDCVVKIPNRFKLVMLAAQRSRELSVGAELTVDRDNDKNPVVSLREIADETVSLDGLENGLVKGLQRHVEVEEPMPDEEAMLGVEAVGAIDMSIESDDEDEDEGGEGEESDEIALSSGFEDDPSAVNDGKIIDS